MEELAADAERAGLAIAKKEQQMWRVRLTEFEFIAIAGAIHMGEKAMQYAKVHDAGSSKLKHKAAERLLKEARSCNKTFGPDAQFSDSEKFFPVKRRVQALTTLAGNMPCYLCGKIGHFKIDCPLNAKPIRAPDRIRKCFKCGGKGHLASECAKA